MAMKTLAECIADAALRKVALGHFNFSDSEQLKAIFEVAQRLSLPVLVGTAEGERDFIGVHQAAALVRSLREEHGHPIYLNADHTYSFDRVKEAVDAGYDAVIFDGAKLPLAENIEITKRCVAYAKEKNPSIFVEGELGYIGTSSKLLDAIPEGAAVTAAQMTSPEEAAQFVSATGVDLLAPAVGNIHGMLKHTPDPHLDIERISKVREAAGVPLVLHGGSGTPDEDFVQAIESGVSIIHINTELRVAYRGGIEATLKEKPDEIAPYRFLAGGIAEMEKTVEARLRLFSKLPPFAQSS
jgi:fructose-bisphosphate aldolase, class II